MGNFRRATGPEVLSEWLKSSACRCPTRRSSYFLQAGVQGGVIHNAKGSVSIPLGVGRYEFVGVGIRSDDSELLIEKWQWQ